MPVETRKRAEEGKNPKPPKDPKDPKDPKPIDNDPKGPKDPKPSVKEELKDPKLNDVPFRPNPNDQDDPKDPSPNEKDDPKDPSPNDKKDPKPNDKDNPEPSVEEPKDPKVNDIPSRPKPNDKDDSEREDPEDLIFYGGQAQEDRLNKEAIVGYKNAWGNNSKTVITRVGPQNAYLYRLKSRSAAGDDLDTGKVSDVTLNRLADVRDDKGKFKYAWKDVLATRGAAYRVPEKYEGKPEDLLKPREKIKGEKPHDVLVLIKWRKSVGLDKDGGNLKTWETRGGVRRLKHSTKNGDIEIYETAMRQEERHREWKIGTREAESRSPTPRENTPDIEVTPPTDDKNLLAPPGGTTTDPNKTVAAAKTEEALRAEKKAAMKLFLDDYLLATTADKWEDLTTEQQSKGITSFRNFWDRQQPTVAV
jgi:hypothetical protein